MLQRILNFDKGDWHHLAWLLKHGALDFIKGDIADAYECYMLIKLHLSYDSTKKR